MNTLNDFIPYGRHLIDDDDIAAVVEVLHSDWLTTGPTVSRFEEAVASRVGAAHAVAVSNGTAALHCAVACLDLQAGDEVIVPSMTFAATANAVVYCGAVPVFADVSPRTLLISPQEVERKITSRTRAVIAVDYAGQPCDYEEVTEICNGLGLTLIADSCHALGAEYKGKMCGSIADMTVFSFHPVKHITSGEGGMITTDRPDWAERMRSFRNHGISLDHSRRAEKNIWTYEITNLGYNYRLSDIQCALGLSQLNKLETWLERRRVIAGCYDKAFAGSNLVRPLEIDTGRKHAYHLYVVELLSENLLMDRAEIFQLLRERKIGVNVHYIPVHLHPFYQKMYGYRPGCCPEAELMYERIITLPLHQGMRDEDVQRVIDSIEEITRQAHI